MYPPEEVVCTRNTNFVVMQLLGIHYIGHNRLIHWIGPLLDQALLLLAGDSLIQTLADQWSAMGRGVCGTGMDLCGGGGGGGGEGGREGYTCAF